MTSINGSVAFVSGANRGIGRAFVEELLAAGAKKVYAGARNIHSLDDLADYGAGKVVPVEVDVTDTDTIEAAAAASKDVTILINNAGIAGFQGLISATDGNSARGEMETNFFGTLNMVRSFAPALAWPPSRAWRVATPSSSSLTATPGQTTHRNHHSNGRTKRWQKHWE